MKVALASDHAGYDLKKQLIAFVQKLGHETIDLGTCDTTPVDYPDFAEKLGLSILRFEAERGILLCGSGVGASVAANKLSGIKAAVCHDTYSSHQGVEHDDMNVLVIGARVIGPMLAEDLVSAFLQAQFSGEERHRRRLGKVRALEERYGRCMK